MDIAFATHRGVLGHEQCDSVGIALEIGNRIESVQVEHCQASNDQDKHQIFAHIRTQLGSLERMDEKIREMIKE